MTRLRNALLALGLVLGGVVAGVAAFGGGVPNVPVSPTFSEPSQIVPTLNAFVQMLNGTPGPMNAAPGVVSLGSYGTISGGTPQTLNTARGVVTFTGVTVAAVTTSAVVINNNLITTNSACVAGFVSDNSAAGSFPYIRSVVPTAGVLTVNISNAAAATSTGASSFGVAYSCVN